jgi:uncharacterized integral membrane protein
MDNATVSSLYCIALYDNYIALNEKVQKWRALTVRPVMLLLVFFLVLQNRTIGFEIKSL